VLHSFCNQYGGKNFEEWCRRADEMIERVAPPGLKKKFQFLSADANPEVNDAGLPSHRTIQEFEIGRVLDELGTFAVDTLGLDVGDVEHAQREGLLQKLVGFLYQTLEDLVSNTGSAGLLEWLVAHDEAIVAERGTQQ